ncbi:MAG: epoxyqueuosine reductase QueH [Spirochaetota bacterium]
MARIVVHTCCAPCAVYPYTLMHRIYDAVFFFYNPNIHPAVEFARRRDEVKRFAERSDMRFVVEAGDEAAWEEAIRGYENEPERGRRCERCFRFRLSKTAEYAGRIGATEFTTVMSISPHKDTAMLDRIGADVSAASGVEYIPVDFKKNDGFKKASVLSRAEGFYRQNYCGCRYSMRCGPPERLFS